MLDGRKLEFSESKVYVLLYKPRGYLCTVHDPQGRPIVTDLIKGIKERIYPVGRLDQNSEGLMMLTNDGDVALKMTHPRYQVKKTYMVLVSGVPTKNQVQALQRGVELEDGVTSPAGVKVIKQQGKKWWLQITVSEGKKRQVRRMCGHVGLSVVRLKRTALEALPSRD